MSIVVDEEAFVERLESFRVETWFAKPDAMSPAICAARGWSNVSPDKLQCQTCKATLSYMPSTDILEEEDPEEVERFVQNLEWEHDADCVWCENQCPSEFMTLQTGDPLKLRQEIDVRFKRLNTLWDVPKIEEGRLFDAPQLVQRIKALEQSLHAEWCGNVVCLIPGVDLMSEPWRQRTRVAALLSLLGWNLFVMDYRLAVELEEENAQWTQSSVLTKPEEFGCCLARQCVLYCGRCTASVGLWSCPSVAFVPLEIFRDISKKNIQNALQIMIDPETGEVEDLFRRTYKDEDFVIRPKLESPVETAQKESESDLTGRQSLSLDLDRVGSRPVFGLQCLKKRKLETAPSLPEDGHMRLEDIVSSGVSFDPVHEHRVFCPYRTQWKQILESVAKHSAM